MKPPDLYDQCSEYHTSFPFYRSIEFASTPDNGNFSHHAVAYDSSENRTSIYLGWQVEAVKKVSHGDWKTQSVRDYFMGMQKGESGILEKIFSNFHGTWATVRVADREIKTCDVDPRCLIVVSMMPHDLAMID